MCKDGKEIYKKAWCTCRVVVLLYFFFWRSRCSRRRSFVRSLMCAPKRRSPHPKVRRNFRVFNLIYSDYAKADGNKTDTRGRCKRHWSLKRKWVGLFAGPERNNFLKEKYYCWKRPTTAENLPKFSSYPLCSKHFTNSKKCLLRSDTHTREKID